MANELIIACCVVGAELTKETYPYLPTTPREIADAAVEAVKAGASIIHLHVRDEQGRPTQRVDIFEQVSTQIKNSCDCILQFSTGGAVGTTVDERCAPLVLRPEMGTLSMGTMNFGDGIFENGEKTIFTIADVLKKQQVMPELEIFDYGMLETVERYLRKGLVPAHFHIDFVLGIPGGMSGEIRNLVLLVDKLEKIRPGQSWSVAGVGRWQLPLTTTAIAMGGHVRIGIEDNIYYRKGELVKSNADLIKRVVRIANEFDRHPASVATTREILGL
ncbi:MAG: 3-keto-5-aminohexanoate cleavage protein [Oligoflexia bacterium]|nr:3-keto-5-aminohexanoate cleavage protein [Oligoflexia bacterium]